MIICILVLALVYLDYTGKLQNIIGVVTGPNGSISPTNPSISIGPLTLDPLGQPVQPLPTPSPASQAVEDYGFSIPAPVSATGGSNLS